ncbi:MAG: transcriptional regulator GcvA [Xanthobacteraceae bacterium]|nr:transcriptional regulator GcvA [Xanthobacteraceae bacterium]
MPWSPPSLSAARAFEAAARTLNFTRAAAELGQTQGAISHQARELEDRLGIRLFERRARGLALTEAGRRYLPYVQDALARLRAGEELIRGAARGAVLTVSVSPNFASKWLVPRLGQFSQAHPDLDLRISASVQHVDFGREDIDLAVRHGDGDWPDLHVTRLCAESLFPVCSPGLLRSGPPIRAVADLARHVLIHDRDRGRWHAWLAACGVAVPVRDRGPVFDQTALAIDAAVAGQGIALARSALAALDLIAGRLVRPLPDAVPAEFAYWIVCRKAVAAAPKIRRFRAWLLAQAAADARAL